MIWQISWNIILLVNKENPQQTFPVVVVGEKQEVQSTVSQLQRKYEIKQSEFNLIHVVMLFVFLLLILL